MLKCKRLTRSLSNSLEWWKGKSFKYETDVSVGTVEGSGGLLIRKLFNSLNKAGRRDVENGCLGSRAEKLPLCKHG